MTPKGYQVLLLMYLVSNCACAIQESTTQENVTPGPPDGTPKQVTDHRFFLQQIFHKYGHEGQMTFEGFEHLLESLGLGNVFIRDHDLAAHKEDDENPIFKDYHGTHEHTMQSDMPSTGKEEMKKEWGLPLPKHLASGSSPKPAKPTGHHDHDHDNSETQGHRHHHENYKPNGVSIPERTGPSTDTDSRKPNITLPELLHNLTTLVDQHREMVNQQPQYFVKQCLSPTDILLTFDVNPASSLDASTFLHLCPAIIYQLDQRHCTTGAYRHHDDDLTEASVLLQQWLYAALAVLLISLCGLFSVAVIPIMQKWFYQTMLQFLVGLAIGSLSGDALLHLMPHAMRGGEEEEGDHHEHVMSSTMEQDSIWRGMAALGGIYFFFFAERLLNALTTYRRNKKLAKNSRARSRTSSAYGPLSTADGNGTVGEKLSQYRRASLSIHNGIDGKETVQMLPDPTENKQIPSYDPTRKVSYDPPRKVSYDLSRKGSNQSCHEVGFHGRSSFSAEPGVHFHDNGLDNCVVTVSEHHGHGHGHSHEVPQSVSAVAWMVIMGDGLHNFCDGLAIGAAFSSKLAIGISTTVAVFCHELPHELGDFAMLLKTGMKVKQALFYNALSSVLCFMGMIVGVSLGNITSATSWVFAGTAGMFLYIALVDMLPELQAGSDDPGVTSSYQLAVQVLGISIGISVMLLIAIYEHDLMMMVS